ncbi:MAG TPA: tetratricopeptide repeat protein [Bacteroidales bacterium]|nr:tetratricopeptide repeat protein [Bacteroidales bacterium]
MKLKSLIWTLAIVLIAGTACNRKVVPTTTKVAGENQFDEASYSYFYVEAIKQKLLGNVGDALKYFEQCIKINPRSDASYYQMAQIVLMNGDVKDGKDFVKKAIDINEKNVWYLTMLASIYYQQKDIDSAIIYYQKAVKLFPERKNLELSLGNLYTEDSKYQKAYDIFNGFDTKYGVNEQSTISTIRCLMAEEKYEEALVKSKALLKLDPESIVYNGILAEIYRSLGENDEARSVYDKLLEDNPGDPQTQLALCNFLVETKNYDDLFLILNEVILNDKVNRQAKISLIAKLIDLPGTGKNFEDRLMNAITVLEANYDKDYIVPLLRPELLIKENRLKEASDLLESIVKALPDDYYAWEKLLLVYLQEGDYKSLMNWGEKCATKYNTSYLAKVLYANGAMEEGKYNIALDELKKAEILAGDNKDSLVQVITMKADIYYRMKDYKRTFELFDSALIYNNNDLTVLNNYAYYLAQQGMKLKEAEEMIEKVIAKEGNNNTFLDTYAWVLYKRGKTREAASVMQKIIQSGDTSSAEYFEHYGYILKRLGKCDQAVDNWKEAIKLDSTKTNLEKEIKDCTR